MKKFLKALLVMVLLITSILLLSVGPLFNLKIKDNQVTLTSEVTEEVTEEGNEVTEEAEGEIESSPDVEAEQPEVEVEEQPEVEPGEQPEEPVDEVIDEGIILGEEVLKYLKIELENKYYLQTISSWISGFLFAIAISLMFKKCGKKTKKGKKGKQTEVTQTQDSGLRVRPFVVVSQNNNKRN